jgi:primosomal protein N''
MKIYAYGIIDSNSGMDEPLRELGEVSVYNIPYRDIAVTVSELNDEAKEITDTYILEHERIVERLMEGFTVLPMRFLTVFNTKKDLLCMAEFYYEDFKDNLARLHNKVEFGMKVIWSADTIKQRIAAALDKAKRNVVISTDSPAKSFVKEKYEKHMIEKEFEEEANSCIAAVDDYFNKIACEKKLKRLQTENLLLNSSYLVEKQRQNDFKQAFEQLKNTPGDLKFLFSGPWPCYNFVTLTKKPSSVDYFNTEDMLGRLLKTQDL